MENTRAQNSSQPGCGSHPSIRLAYESHKGPRCGELAFVVGVFMVDAVPFYDVSYADGWHHWVPISRVADDELIFNWPALVGNV
jgi:hypothetical protein